MVITLNSFYIEQVNRDYIRNIALSFLMRDVVKALYKK